MFSCTSQVAIAVHRRDGGREAFHQDNKGWCLSLTLPPLAALAFTRDEP